MSSILNEIATYKRQWVKSCKTKVSEQALLSQTKDIEPLDYADALIKRISNKENAVIAEVKKFFDKTVILSGCISTGRDIASALQMGADLAYMGTRFINTEESKATEEYRKMIIDAGAGDVVYTAAISGVHANFLSASLRAAGVTEEALKKDTKIDFGKELDTEAKAWKTIWSAGQGVTTIDNVLPVSDLIQDLKDGFKTAIQAQAQLLNTYPKD